MSPFPAELFTKILPDLLPLSDYDMEPYVREKIQKFVDEGAHPAHVLYDFMAEIAALPCFRIKPDFANPLKIAVGDISGFVQAFCDVKQHYERPTEGGV
jgi:hypothetical protein